MINKLIWDKVEELFYWNISVDSPINQLPFTTEFIINCQKEFSMKVRDKEYSIRLGSIMDWRDKTMGDFVKEIDKQYQSNYFVSENGTSTTGVVGKVHDIDDNPVANKWNIRGEALVERLKQMQKEKPNLTILDMGCGANEYKKHLNNVTGVDPYRKEADVICSTADFKPADDIKWDVIICFGCNNWYTYDEQYRNFMTLKNCLAPNGILLWSHIHNYYKMLQPDHSHAYTWIHGDIEHAHKNSAFLYSDRDWKYIWYFNWTEHAVNTLSNHVGLSVDKIDYDHCNLYRPPMYRIFVEMTHR